jgi:hypothetical protein
MCEKHFSYDTETRDTEMHLIIRCMQRHQAPHRRSEKGITLTYAQRVYRAIHARSVACRRSCITAWASSSAYACHSSTDGMQAASESRAEFVRTQDDAVATDTDDGSSVAPAGVPVAAPGDVSGTAPAVASAPAPAGDSGAAPGPASGAAPGGISSAVPGQVSGEARGGVSGRRFFLRTLMYILAWLLCTL